MENEVLDCSDTILEQSEKEVKFRKVQQKIRVVDTNPITFMNNIQDLILKGCRIEHDKYPQLRGPLLQVDLVKDCDLESLEEDLVPPAVEGYHAFSIERDQLRYEEDFVKELDWDSFKKLCKSVGISGRDRNKMTKQYFQVFEG